MSVRQAWIYTCDRCKAETEAKANPHKGALWFRNDKFMTDSMEAGTLKSTKSLCDKCINELHVWWNEGHESNYSNSTAARD